MPSPPDKWVEFYSPLLGIDSAANLVARCEGGQPGNTAKLMLYQTQRLVSLADEVVQLRAGRQSLQVLFLLICAEHVAKLAAKFQSEGRSRHYVKEFFRRFADVNDRRLLDEGFTTFDHRRLGWETAIDGLYDVRCDVVHEGNYWTFAFRYDDLPMLNMDPDLIAHITLQDFRDIVVRTAVRAIQEQLTHDLAA